MYAVLIVMWQKGRILMCEGLFAHDNYVLLETAYLLLHAARDIICNNTGDLYALLRDHSDQETQKQLHSTLELLASCRIKQEMSVS